MELRQNEKIFDYFRTKAVLEDIVVSDNKFFSCVIKFQGVNLFKLGNGSRAATFNQVSNYLNIFKDVDMSMLRLSKNTELAVEEGESEFNKEYTRRLNEVGIFEHTQYIYLNIQIDNKKKIIDKIKDARSIFQKNIKHLKKNMRFESITVLKNEKLVSFIDILVNKRKLLQRTKDVFPLNESLANGIWMDSVKSFYCNDYFHTTISMEYPPEKAVQIDAINGYLEKECRSNFIYLVNYKEADPKKINKKLEGKIYFAQLFGKLTTSDIVRECEAMKADIETGKRILTCHVSITFFEKDKKVARNNAEMFLENFNRSFGAQFVYDDNMQIFGFLNKLPGHSDMQEFSFDETTDKVKIFAPIAKRWKGHIHEDLNLVNASYENIPLSMYKNNEQAVGHALLIGMTGLGKGFFTNKFMHSVLSRNKNAVGYVSDYGDSYESLVEHWDGINYIIGLDKPLSPLPAKRLFLEEKAKQGRRMQYIQALLDEMISEEGKNLSKAQLMIVNKVVFYMYKHIEDVSIFSIKDILLNVPTKIDLDAEQVKLAKQLGQALEYWCNKPYDVFFKQGLELDLSKRIIGLNKKAIENDKKLLPIITLFEIYIINELTDIKEKQKYVVVDEVSKDLSSPISAQAIQDLTERGRKDGICLYTITQVLTNLTKNTAGQTLIANSPTKIFFSLKCKSSLAQEFIPELTDIDIKIIQKMEMVPNQYSELYWISKQNKEQFRFYSHPIANWTFTTKPEEKRKRDEYIKKYGSRNKANLLLAKEFPWGIK